MGVTKVIAVFGLSGVGKSATVRRVVSESRGLAATVNAGQLIRRRHGDDHTPETLRLLPAEEIRRNQELLVEELARARSTGGAPVLLLDGHCLIDNGEQLVPIPIEVIERLDLAALVFVQEGAAEIRARRLADSKRARPNLPSADLARHQQCALAVCHGYASRLGLPLTVVTAQQWPSILRLVEESAAPIDRGRGNPTQDDRHDAYD